MPIYREKLQEAAQYDSINSKGQQRLGSLCNPADYATTIGGPLDAADDVRCIYGEE